ncbi:MAG TPA: hypothetical protein VJ997_12395 [Longimicrobiales bacterium]|nr:hypothetical protein [Longimicrobiales bacterium]
MRRAPVLLALATTAVATLAFGAPAAAQDLSGTWELTWETPRGVQTVPVTFQVDGMSVTGTAQMRMGEVPIKNGMLHGDQLMFAIEFTMGDRTMTQNFLATVTGDTMEGKITTPRGENPFKGARKKD